MQLVRQAIVIINSTLPDSMLSHGYDHPRWLWLHLESTYGTAGPMAIFTLLKKAIRTKLHTNKDPSTMIAELATLFTLMDSARASASIDASMPELIRALILLNALLDNWENVVSMYLHSHSQLSEVNWESVHSSINTEWQRQVSQQTTMSSNNNNNYAAGPASFSQAAATGVCPQHPPFFH